MVNLNGHEAGNGGHSQGKPTVYRDSSTRRDGKVSPAKARSSLSQIRMAQSELTELTVTLSTNARGLLDLVVFKLSPDGPSSDPVAQ